tara:strand:- start:4691 stop:4831 length:141 start_codon:yes stop_codon:yes gene_type:complete
VVIKKFFLRISLCLLIASCGQRGPLVHPESQFDNKEELATDQQNEK